MTHFGIIVDEEYNATHKRNRITVWSGPFASVLEAEGLSLPKGDGYMLTTYHGDKVRVECSVERTDENYQEQDAAINKALNEHFTRGRLEYLRSQIDKECISQGELLELQGLADFIEPGDVQLLEWAGVPEFPEGEERAYVPNGKSVIRKR